MDEKEKEFAERGSRIIDSTHGAITGKFYMIRVLSDCVFSVLRKKANVGTDGAATTAADCLAEYGVGGSISVKAGAVLTAPNNCPFSDITLTSGQVNGFNA
jgi:hypothetical protein